MIIGSPWSGSLNEAVLQNVNLRAHVVDRDTLSTADVIESFNCLFKLDYKIVKKDASSAEWTPTQNCVALHPGHDIRWAKFYNFECKNTMFETWICDNFPLLDSSIVTARTTLVHSHAASHHQSPNRFLSEDTLTCWIFGMFESLACRLSSFEFYVPFKVIFATVFLSFNPFKALRSWLILFGSFVTLRRWAGCVRVGQ